MELDGVCEGGSELISEQPEQVDGPSKDTQNAPFWPEVSLRTRIYSTAQYITFLR